MKRDWFAVVAGPAAWFAAHVGSWMLVPGAHEAGPVGALYAIDAIALAVAITAGVIALGRSRRRAVVFWWALIYGRYGRAGYGVGVAFVFFTMLYSGLLGAVLSLADHALYAHAEPTLRWGIDPVDDQQRAGLIMWVPAGIVMISVALAIFAAWLGQSALRVGRSAHPSLAGKDAR